MTSLDGSPLGLRGVLIVGTDTEVGKTYQACRLARSLTQLGQRIGVYKPVASGESLAGESDAELLRAAAQSGEPLERICPQSFRAPLAPPLAANLENRRVDEQLLVDGALWWQGRCDYLIVEGVGGVLSPISPSRTVLDIAARLRLPIVIVAANRLGVVNHAQLTVEAILTRGLPLTGIVLNDMPAAGSRRQTASDISPATNLELLRSFIDDTIPIAKSIENLPLTNA